MGSVGDATANGAEQRSDTDDDGLLEEVVGEDGEQVAGDDEGAGETEEPSPAEDVAFYLGWLVAAYAIGSMFVGPLAVFEISLGGPIPLEGTAVSGLGPVPYISGATLLVAFLGALGVERVVEEGMDGNEVAYAIGLIMPTIMVVVALFAVMLFFPVVHYLLAGQLLYATGFLLAMALLVAIAANAFTFIAAATIVALLYLLLPALVGAYAARGVTRFASTISP